MTPTMTSTTSSGLRLRLKQFHSCTCADTGFAERPRFFARQMVTPDDLMLGQDYQRNKIRRLIRYMLGFGAWCAAAAWTCPPRFSLGW